MATPRRAPDPRALALAAWCRDDGGPLDGRFALASLTRLCEGLAALPDGEVRWRASGETVAPTGREAESRLHLQAEARVPLQCQRCLGPLAVELTVDRRFRFVRGEDEAARLDEDSDDDVLALPARLDLRELVEDELILALPIVPRHDGACVAPLPQAPPAVDPMAPPREVPAAFAALANWSASRRDRSDGD